MPKQMRAPPGISQDNSDEATQGSACDDVDSGQSAGGSLPSISANAEARSKAMPRPMNKFCADSDDVLMVHPTIGFNSVQIHHNR